MKYGVIEYCNNKLIFSDEKNDSTPAFCQERRSLRNSECARFYRELFNGYDAAQKSSVALCPYGLYTTTPFGNAATLRVVSGFYVCDQAGGMPADKQIPQSAYSTNDEIQSVVSLVEQVSSEIRSEETEHFEAALHDARHLNHSITQHAERILDNLGFPPDAEWNMYSIQQDEMARRALSIYAASRDLSDAISMHEITQDVSRAQKQKSPTPVHKLFYRQIKISAERLQKAGVSCSLGSTQRSIMLTPEFKLIPKILIDNAVKYSARGSEIAINFYETSHFFKIVCTNQGPIIKADEWRTVFVRGVRGSNISGVKGRGIGLWLAKVIIDANMGGIEISTEEKSRDYSGRKLGVTSITIRLSY